MNFLTHYEYHAPQMRQIHDNIISKIADLLSNSNMNSKSNQISVFQTRRTFHFSSQEVFNAFASPTRIEKWWGPNGFTNSFEVFEFKTQGVWIFTMHAPDGVKYPNKCIFREITNAKQIVIDHVVQPFFTLTIDLLDVNGGTELVWTQKFEDPEIALAMSEIVKKANEENLDRLTLNLVSD